MQTIVIALCGVSVLALLFSFVLVADRRDTMAETSKRDWLDKAKNRICSNLSETGVVTDVVKIFEKIEGLLDNWDELYQEKQNVLTDQNDVEQLFGITIKNIEYHCSQFKEGKCSKGELLSELDRQVLILDQLLSKLASTANIRSVSYV